MLHIFKNQMVLFLKMWFCHILKFTSATFQIWQVRPANLYTWFTCDTNLRPSAVTPLRPRWLVNFSTFGANEVDFPRSHMSVWKLERHMCHVGNSEWHMSRDTNPERHVSRREIWVAHVSIDVSSDWSSPTGKFWATHIVCDPNTLAWRNRPEIHLWTISSSSHELPWNPCNPC